MVRRSRVQSTVPPIVIAVFVTIIGLVGVLRVILDDTIQKLEVHKNA